MARHLPLQVLLCFVGGEAVRHEFPIGRLHHLLMVSSRQSRGTPLEVGALNSFRHRVSDTAPSFRAPPSRQGTELRAWEEPEVGVPAFEPLVTDPWAYLDPDYSLVNPRDPSVRDIQMFLERMPRTVESLRFDGNGDLSLAGWAKMLNPISSPRSVLRSVDFEGCGLDDQRAAILAQLLRYMSTSVRRLEVGGNARLSADAWISLLRPLSDASSRLSDFSFGWCDLDDARAFAIAAAVDRMGPNVRKLGFSENPALSPDAWAALLQPIALTPSGLTLVSFSQCRLDDRRARAISLRLPKLPPTVHELDFTGCRRLGPSGWGWLLQAISAPRCRLKRISFAYCDLDDARANVISKELENIGPRLAKLDFSLNLGVSPAGWKALLAPIVRPQSRFQEVNFRQNSLVDETAQVIGKQLSRMPPSLRRVDFRQNAMLSASSWRELLQPLTDRDSPLEEVDFGNCGLSKRRAIAISDMLERVQPHVKKMSFGANSRLTPDAWKVLLRPFTLEGAGLKEFTLAGCDLDDKCARAVGRQLSILRPTLEALNFADNPSLGFDGWTWMLQAIRNPRSRLKRISFADCDLDDDKADAISKELDLLGPIMRRLDLSFNSKLTASGWARLLASLGRSDSNLVEVDLGSCNLEDARANAIAGELARMRPTVERLILAGSFQLSAQSWTALLRPLARAGISLEELDLGGCRLDDGSVRSIATELNEVAPTVKKISIRENYGLTGKGWSAMLSPLTSVDCRLEELSFGRTNLNDETAKEISELLRNMSPTMKSLDFAGNMRLSRLGWGVLLRPMTFQLANLEKVNLAECRLNDVRAEAISARLSRLSPTLKTLDLQGNPRLSRNGWTSLLGPLSAADIKLEQLSLAGCDLDDRQAERIGQNLAKLRPSVRKVSLEGFNKLSPSVWEVLLNAAA